MNHQGVDFQEDVRNLQGTSAKSETESLGEIRKPAVDYLLHVLKDPDKWVRYVAADAFRNIGDPCCVENLMEALKDEDQDVRFAVTGPWRKVGSGNACATEALMQAWNGDNCYVRDANERALIFPNQRKEQVARPRTQYYFSIV